VRFVAWIGFDSPLDEVQISSVCPTITNLRNFETSIAIGHGLMNNEQWQLPVHDLTINFILLLELESVSADPTF
jgi:hypothetical protein